MKRDVTSMISYIVYDAGFAALRIRRDLRKRGARYAADTSYISRAARPAPRIVAEFVGFVGCLVKFRPPCLASPFAGAFMFIVEDAPRMPAARVQARTRARREAHCDLE